MENNKKNLIAIIEDEPAMQKVITDAFQISGFDVICESNGQDGLTLILDKKPDLVILDIFMPIMDGEQMIKKLRLDDWGKNVPVVVLTNISLDQSKLAKTIIETTPDFYLIKSDWSIHEIVKKAKEILAHE